MYKPETLGIAAYVGLAYLKQAYLSIPNDPHYREAKKLMYEKLKLAGFKRKNPYIFLVQKKGKKYLLSNLPHMQLLLNIAIDRSMPSVRKVNKAINSLKPKIDT